MTYKVLKAIVQIRILKSCFETLKTYLQQKL